MSIFQLVYLSRISQDFNPTEDMDAIMQIANKRNRKLGITGILIYRDGIFIQLLEGEKDRVLKVYGYVASDFRHTSIKPILKQENTNRLFEEWTMGYRNLSKASKTSNELLESWNDLVHRSQNHEKIENKTILDLLKKFRYQK